MYSEAGIGLAHADRSIAQAERNLQQLNTLLPQLAERGFETREIETHMQTLGEILDNLRSQRWEIEGFLGQP
ncbi:MAG: hypothetical protein NW223_17125 [Hyphomicrobiaceae bacterium]|nr:hypothetical protein [Hyphomicrobiaceae bacterium]